MTVFSIIWGSVAILGSVISYALHSLKMIDKDTMFTLITCVILLPLTIIAGILFGAFHLLVYITKIIIILIKGDKK